MNWSTGRLIFLGVFVCFLLGCKQETKPIQNPKEPEQIGVEFATGFQIDQSGSFPVITVSNPWPNAKKSFKYAFIPKEKLAAITYPKDAYDAVITTPVEKIVATSTTHIPALEALGGLSKLRGFPDTKYISSMPARQLIASKKIKELGNNESLNTEMVLEMQPDALVGFAIDNANTAYDLLQQSGIPVIFNGDWTEQTPLGKAEWIKFFGVLLQKERVADSIFNTIKTDYLTIKDLASKAKSKPTVLSGALYKDVWYLPAGESWASQFIEDANANYLWSNTTGTGSLSLSFEAVLDKGKMAEFWIAPAQFTSYQQLQDANGHYEEFDALKTQNIFTFAATKGATGGLLYYELAPQRPDLVLKDLVHIFHPDLLPDYAPYFFKPLE